MTEMRATRPRLRLRHGLLLALLLAALAVAAWQSPELRRVPGALAGVEWTWAGAALAANAVSILLRGSAFAIVLREALPGGGPALRHVMASFAAGVMTNALLPARAGEVARLVVLAPHLPSGNGAWLTAGGAIFAHHLLDAVPQAGVVAFVVYETGIPLWAIPPLALTVGAGTVLLLAAVVWVRRRGLVETRGGTGRVATLARRLEVGLTVYRSPAPALAALLLQIGGWTAELGGILFAFRAFGIDAPLASAGAVLLLSNIATLLPFWPGNVGVFQAAVAAPLLASGVGLAHALLFGIGLQAIEVTIAIALGIPALAYEGVSFGALAAQSRAQARSDRDSDGSGGDVPLS